MAGREREGAPPLKRGDGILFAALIGCSALMLLARRVSGGGAIADARVRVVQDGVEIGDYPLSADLSFTVTSADGGTNAVSISDGACVVTDADCPDGICVRRGAIRRRGETIVCLPHRLVLEIVGGEDSGVDAVAR